MSIIKSERNFTQINNNKKKPAAIDELCKSIGDRIKGIRNQKGLTQKQFAKKLKVSQQLISRIESGRENISIITLKNIAKALNTRVLLDIK
ncbi:MAG: helix-turn-helix domain-containing protein [Elusimicrobia bacterium]|nr:helix-turn-helix domain-containing protein [Elusimicrobiota bacterium]